MKEKEKKTQVKDKKKILWFHFRKDFFSSSRNFKRNKMRYYNYVGIDERKE